MVTMLFALGISHRTARVEQREKVSLSRGRAGNLLQDLAVDDWVGEVVALSTCNRTELYAAVQVAHLNLNKRLLGTWRAERIVAAELRFPYGTSTEKPAPVMAKATASPIIWLPEDGERTVRISWP